MTCGVERLVHQHHNDDSMNVIARPTPAIPAPQHQQRSPPDERRCAGSLGGGGTAPLRTRHDGAGAASSQALVYDASILREELHHLLVVPRLLKVTLANTMLTLVVAATTSATAKMRTSGRAITGVHPVATSTA